MHACRKIIRYFLWFLVEHVPANSFQKIPSKTLPSEIVAQPAPAFVAFFLLSLVSSFVLAPTQPCPQMPLLHSRHALFFCQKKWELFVRRSVCANTDGTLISPNHLASLINVRSHQTPPVGLT